MASISIENIQAQAKEAQTEAVEATTKAIRFQLGLLGLAYDAVTNVVENSNDWFTRAVDRGEKIEDSARGEFEKYSGIVEERFGKYQSIVEEQVETVQTRVNSLIKRGETAVEEKVEIVAEYAEDAADKAEAVAEAVVAEIEMPIANYDTFTAKDVVAQLSDMSQEKLLAIKEYEVANQNRVTIVREINRKLDAVAA